MSENQFRSERSTPASPSSGSTDPPMSGVDALIKESSAQSYWARRLVAFVIDAIIVSVVLVVVAAVIVIPSFVLSGGAGMTFFAGSFALVAGVILFLYFIVAEITRGATIGKQAMHLKVVGPKGGNPTLVQSLVRNISKVYWLLLLLDVVIGLATSKQYNQKYSDKLVGTSVVG